MDRFVANIKRLFFGVVMIGIFFLAFGDSGAFTDSRVGLSYRTVRFGNFTWMAQNLNFQTGNSWCYNNNESNCQKYGRLYDWNTAMVACPAGWRLPTDDDWNNLVEAVGGYDVADTRLKSGSPDWNGTDDFGFSALLGGHRDTDGTFWNVGTTGDWWSATEHDATIARYRLMLSDDRSEESSSHWGDKTLGFSLRCVAD
jgi:uncharacterized protein (TIGR02145 family)